MTAELNWVVEWMKNYPEFEDHENVVYEIGWRCNASETVDDKTYETTCYGSVPIKYKETDTFVPYEDLTLEIVLEWVWENGVNKEEIETSLQDQITAKINPVVVELPLPWVA